VCSQADHLLSTARRIRIDIKDLFVPGAVPAGCAATVIGKHLCGGATDLALRAALRATDPALCARLAQVHALRRRADLPVPFVRLLIGY
jgi:hypothetical protein